MADAPPAAPGARSRERILALDVGGKRIGVAIADETGTIATPLGYVRRGPGDLGELRRLVERWHATRLVVGLPTGLSGREGPQAAAVRAFAEEVAAALGLPLDYWDERLTTAIAERALSEAGTKRGKRKEQIDAVAAAIILQGYLDAARRRAERRQER